MWSFDINKIQFYIIEFSFEGFILKHILLFGKDRIIRSIIIARHICLVWWHIIVLFVFFIIIKKSKF